MHKSCMLHHMSKTAALRKTCIKLTCERTRSTRASSSVCLAPWARGTVEETGPLGCQLG